MKKTQVELASRLVNRFNRGSYKEGWSLTEPVKGNPFLTLQKLNEIEQAHKLAEKYPLIFKSESRAWRLTHLTLLDDLKARELLKRYEGV